MRPHRISFRLAIPLVCALLGLALVAGGCGSSSNSFKKDFTAKDKELEKLGSGYESAAQIFGEVALADEFTEFLTLPAYETLMSAEKA